MMLPPAETQKRHKNPHFHQATCDFFNRVESLLRAVLSYCKQDAYFRMAQRCLDGIWRRYSDMLNF